MSAIDTLRRAEALLREGAERATTGPWEAAVPGTVESPSGPVAEMHEVVYANSEADAAYIALMDPLVGLALAEWLDAEADDLEVFLSLNPEQEDALPLPTERAAHALALRVLGEEE